MSSDEYAGCLEKHIEHGLFILSQETEKMSGYEYLLKFAQLGMKGIVESASNEQAVFPRGYEEVLSINIGKNLATQESFKINFNDISKHSNNYMGIMGKPGSGKTYFIKDFLVKLREESSFKTHFIIFDYDKGDIANDSKFVENSKAKLIDVDKDKMPLSFFKIKDTSHSKEKLTENLVDIFQSLDSRIGNVQGQNLYECVIGLYEMLKDDSMPYPDFEMIKDKLDETTERADSLTALFRPLVEQKVFSKRNEKVLDTLLSETLVVDIHQLGNDKLKNLCVFLILNQLYRELMALPDSQVINNKIREMRIVLVIDEAHHLLEDKNRSKILERLIREIRSKGASVILLSQSPSDYDQSSFDYLELLEFVFVLGCNPSSDKFLRQAFGLSSEKAKKIRSDLNGLNTGEAFTKGANKELVKLKTVRIDNLRYVHGL